MKFLQFENCILQIYSNREIEKSFFFTATVTQKDAQVTGWSGHPDQPIDRKIYFLVFFESTVTRVFVPKMMPNWTSGPTDRQKEKLYFSNLQ
ncbi:hypothetical protein B9Z55_013078 [Caenorhabditis nigoni]|nr:hypothetical protein B9Z55_013078 [Caenorhabditis nigoni]